jgi:N-methylhydantoinase A
MSDWRFAIDSGGTFTDLVAIGPDGRELALKVPSVPAEPVLGPMNAIEAALRELGEVRVDDVAHGTTVGLNALLQRRFPSVALIVTRGFRNVLEIARHTVPGQWGAIYSWVKPPRVVPLEWVIEIDERVDVNGTVLEPLSAASVAAAVERIAAGGVETAAICLLHSYRNPAHEQAVARALRDRLPALPLSLSSEIMPEFREYERMVTTATNAVLTPLVGRYLGEFGTRARARLGGATRVFVMRSAGGVVDVDEAARQPLRTALSGPAGGVLGMARLALEAGHRRALTFDMGGTSTDVAAVEDGDPPLTTEAMVDTYPLRAPTIDLVTIGAGGGSVIALGLGDRLTVGPTSAGAVPGPACYERGGTQPTVTDANLVLGRLPAALLGGSMPLSVDAARAALTPLAARLGLSVEALAATAVEIVDNNMAGAVRQVSIRRGIDPRDYTLVAFGGAGPPHATRLAELVGIRRVLVPPHPGMGSCNGMLIADAMLDEVRTCVLTGRALNADALRAVQTELASSLAAAARALPAGERRLRYRIDLRYVGMGSEIRIGLEPGDFEQPQLDALFDRFHADYRRLFGYDYRGRHAIESLALRAELRVARLGQLPPVQLPHGTTQVRPRAQRRAVLDADGVSAELAVFSREDLPAGWSAAGPLFIDQYDSTTLVRSNQQVAVDPYGNLLIEIGA